MGILHWYLIIYYFSVWLLVMYVSFGALGSAVGFAVLLLWAQLSVLRFCCFGFSCLFCGFWCFGFLWRIGIFLMLVSVANNNN